MSGFTSIWDKFSGKKSSSRDPAREQFEEQQREEARMIREMQEIEARGLQEKEQWLQKRKIYEVQVVVGQGTTAKIAAPQTARFKKTISV